MERYLPWRGIVWNNHPERLDGQHAVLREAMLNVTNGAKLALPVSTACHQEQR